MVSISKPAKEKLIALMKEEGLSPTDSFVRFGVKTGGCSGLSYELSFDKKKTQQDKIFEEGEVKILINEQSVFYLTGTILEYSGGLNGKGFYFNNPNATRTCGCGESFSA